MIGSEAAGKLPSAPSPAFSIDEVEMHVGPRAEREHSAEREEDAEEGLEARLDLSVRGPDGLAGDEPGDHTGRCRGEIREHRVREERHAQALHEHGRHDRTDDGAEDEADDQALQHLGSIWSLLPHSGTASDGSHTSREFRSAAAIARRFVAALLRRRARSARARGSATSTTSRLPRVTAV